MTTPGRVSSPYLRRKDKEFRAANARAIEQLAAEGYVVVTASDLRRCMDSANQDVYARSRLLAALGDTQ